MLYWLETAVIAFWTIVRIATLPRDALGKIRYEGSDQTPSPLGLAFQVGGGAIKAWLEAKAKAARSRRAERHASPCARRSMRSGRPPREGGRPDWFSEDVSAAAPSTLRLR